MQLVYSAAGAALTSAGLQRRPAKLTLSGLIAALALSLATPTLAVDLKGKTLRAEGISDRASANAVDKTFTYALEIYYGTSGNRFVAMKGTSGFTRVLIKAGENRGSRRRKDGNYNQIITITQTAGSVHVVMESRGVVEGYASEGFTFDVSLGSGSCSVTKFKYAPDPRQYLSKSVSRTGTCTITNGPPEGLADN